jgi:phage tail sheath protein FI
MPSTLTYPGVYIEEIPSGVRTITGVATSITALIGGAPRGPVDEPITINSYSDYERIFGGLSNASSMGFAVRDFYLNGGSQAIVVRVINGGTPASIKVPAGTGNFLELVAASPGSWGNNLSATVEAITSSTSLFNLTIVEKDSATQQIVQTENFLNVSILSADARYVPAVLEQGSSLVRVIRNSSGVWVVPAAVPTATTTAVAAASGTDGSPLGDASFSASEAAKKGIYALAKADLFNILCIPPYNVQANVGSTVIRDAAVYCEKRRAMLLVDAPSDWTDKTKAKNGMIPPGVGTTSKNAALFFPRLTKPNPLNGYQMEDFAPCGAVAGIFARTDTNRGVWKAPAGLDATLVGVSKLTVPLTDAENGELNPLGVNCLRTMPAAGAVVWGARTLQGNDQLASEWKYIPIRRTALYIEESLYRGTQWIVFEPNDEPLWAQIRLNVGAFMNNLFRQGAFQGQTPKDAYFVKCDKETNTQNDIDRGIVNILVGFAPLKPAEFVVIKLQQMAGQIQS